VPLKDAVLIGGHRESLLLHSSSNARTLSAVDPFFSIALSLPLAVPATADADALCVRFIDRGHKFLPDRSLGGCTQPRPSNHAPPAAVRRVTCCRHSARRCRHARTHSIERDDCSPSRSTSADRRRCRLKDDPAPRPQLIQPPGAASKTEPDPHFGLRVSTEPVGNSVKFLGAATPTSRQRSRLLPLPQSKHYCIAQ
jgi:hypothetical protein